MRFARCFWSVLGVGLAFTPVAHAQGSSPFAPVDPVPDPQTEPTPSLRIDADAAAQPEAAAPLDSAALQKSDDEQRAAKTRSSSWYGWQTLTVDAVGLATAVWGASENQGGISLVGTSIYALGAPAVHLGHSQYANAAASVGMRLGLPIGGALGGALLGEIACADARNDEDVPCPAVGAAFGFVAGIVTAIAVDAAALAFEPTSRHVTPPAALRLSPQLAVERGGARIGLGGTF